MGSEIVSHIDTQEWLVNNPHQDVVLPDKVWEENQYGITLEEKELYLYHFGPSHGNGMTVLYLPEDRIIFLADIASPKRLPFTIMPSDHPKEIERTVTEIEMLDFDVVMYIHHTEYLDLLQRFQK